MSRLPLAVTALLLAGVLAGCGGDLDGSGDGAADPSTAPESAATVAGLRYVALGDSYSSGPRIPDPTGPSVCMRSTNNYPSQVARKLGAEEFVDVTCAGAATKDMTTSQYPEVAPQLDAVTDGTDVVTIGLGGNDFNLFVTLVGQCAFARAEDPTGAPCRAAMNTTGQDQMLANIDATLPLMVDVVQQVQQRAPDAHVLLVGYPQIVPEHGTCPDLLPLADGDYPWARSVNQALTDMLATVAERTGTTYVDLWHTSAGHDVCAAEPWVNGLPDDPGRAAAFHPFAEGQEAAAEQVLAAIDP